MPSWVLDVPSLHSKPPVHAAGGFFVLPPIPFAGSRRMRYNSRHRNTYLRRLFLLRERRPAMLKIKEGDRVRIVDRPPTPADAKSGLYYSHYRKLSGIVFKLYGSGTSAQAAIDVDLESLPE